MGDGLTDSGDVVIRIADEKASESGQLILESAEYSGSRTVNHATGIGRRKPKAAGYGNESASLSAEGQTNPAMARVLVEMKNEDSAPPTVWFRGKTLEARAGKMDWTDYSWDIGEEEATISIDGDLRDFDLELL